jgi:hypothetical protein
MHAGVLAYDCNFRDVLVTQGGGVVNGHYADGEIAQAYRGDGRVIYSNGSGEATLGGTGDWAKLMANVALGNPGSHAILMAAADDDDPIYRGQIAAVSGGVVDFFDASVTTPTAAFLHTYDCIYTWANNAFADRVTMGDRLADRVDEGGRVILGAFCTYTLGNSLGGRIMTPNYCPVTSPAGNNHFTNSSYAGDGTTLFTGGVAAAACVCRDRLIGQGAGTVCGHYADGEIMVAYRPDGRVTYFNGGGSDNLAGTGDWGRLIANGCNASPPTGRRILYAPAYVDDPVFRGQIAENTGGVVDYFDAQSGTPSALTLANYDCVYTWVANSYQDRVLFGDRLADYVDAGGKVILGAFCTFTTGYSLGGRIMTPGYSPVTSPGGTNHLSFNSYAGDAADCFIHGIGILGATYRDYLVTQGGGLIGGHDGDLEIAYAYRPDRRVVYLNGLHIDGSGDWPRMVANAAECGDPPGVLFGCNDAGELYTLNTKTGASTFDLDLPTFGGVGATEIEFMGNGNTWLQGRNFTASGMGVNLYSGTSITGPLATSRNFDGVEYALGKLYAEGVSAPCGGATLSFFDSTSGTDFQVLGSSGPVPITGLAFDSRWSIMYGITSACAGTSNLLRIDVTNGNATVIGSTYVDAGSLEFGADRDLYMGTEPLGGAALFRINQMTGFTRTVGSTTMGDISGLTLGLPGVVAAGAPPARLEFSIPYPNPSRGSDVQFRFSVPQACNARLDVYDVAGRLRWSRTLTALEAGPHTVSWNGLGSNGAHLASGVYHVLFTSPAGQRSTRIVRLD